jgi:6,7-dimethyl-8-ribityllumazine synthase
MTRSACYCAGLLATDGLNSPASEKSAEDKMAGPSQANKHGDILEGARILIVEGRYYEPIADLLLAGAKRVLEASKVTWDLISVPGALEIPQAIELALDAPVHARRMPFDGVIALGCVIRGETSHYDIVAGESARALMGLAVSRRVPVGNGILTVDTEEQALARAHPDHGDKGGDAARAALSLVRVKRSLAARRESS